MRASPIGHLIGMYLMGVYLIGMHLMGVYLTGMYLMGVYLTGGAEVVRYCTLKLPCDTLHYHQS